MQLGHLAYKQFNATLLLAVLAAVLPSAVLASAVPAQAALQSSCSQDAHRYGTPDVDGDVVPDVVVGVPSGVVDGISAGAVDLRLSHAGTQRVGPASFAGMPAVRGDEFGAHVARIWMDQDFCADLAIAAPGSGGGRGAVVLAEGGANGLQAASAQRLVGRSAGERFGSALAATRSDLGMDLFVGAPDRTVSGKAGAGAVDHYLVPGGGAASYLGSITQDTAGVPGVAEVGDHFGATLAVNGVNGLAVGAPDEATGAARSAGVVTLLQVSPGTARIEAAHQLAQGYEHTPGLAESGDRFGAALTWTGSAFVVGSPGEAVGRAAAAGMVQAFADISIDNPSRLVTTITQDSAGIPGTVEAGDQFGASLAALYGGWCSGETVAVGSPGEDVGSTRDAGSVTVVQDRAPGRSTCERVYVQGSGGLGGAAETGDLVGASLATQDSGAEDDPGPTRLVVGVPGEGVGSAAHAGGITVLTPVNVGTSATSYGDTAGRVYGARYGQSLLVDR
ncbi:hypothetical protein [Angustibacter luteus]|uniref:Uncharacterized protein n=1 Tax=Angustibacter luteus TaxID=658456 RepID=A0ABW1JIH3_9ACTN